MRSSNRGIWASILVMALWGSLYTIVKLGYRVFNIDTAFVPNLLLFAGVRFTIGGFFIILYCIVKKEKITVEHKRIPYLLFVSLFSVVLGYLFQYIGLSNTDSSKTALLKQLGSLFLICFSFLFFKEDKFSCKKVIAGILGLMGIISLNTNSLKFSMGFAEMLIVAASVCGVVSSIFAKKVTQFVSPIITTGYTHLFGGAVLLIIGYLFGGRIHFTGIASVLIFAYICVASVFSYCIWNSVLKNHNLSQLSVIKFMEPLFSGLFGAVLLKENIFRAEYLIAVVLTFTAIMLSHSAKNAVFFKK